MTLFSLFWKPWGGRKGVRILMLFKKKDIAYISSFSWKSNIYPPVCGFQPTHEHLTTKENLWLAESSLLEGGESTEGNLKWVTELTAPSICIQLFQRQADYFDAVREHRLCSGDKKSCRLLCFFLLIISGGEPNFSSRCNNDHKANTKFCKNAPKLLSHGFTRKQLKTFTILDR